MVWRVCLGWHNTPGLCSAVHWSLYWWKCLWTPNSSYREKLHIQLWWALSYRVRNNFWNIDNGVELNQCHHNKLRKKHLERTISATDMVKDFFHGILNTIFLHFIMQRFKFSFCCSLPQGYGINISIRLVAYASDHCHIRYWSQHRKMCMRATDGWQLWNIQTGNL